LKERLCYEEWAAERIQQEIQDYERHAAEIRQTMQITFPEVFKLTQTRRALGFILNHERDEVMEMFVKFGYVPVLSFSNLIVIVSGFLRRSNRGT
jgi:uncharacterized protein Yka (UPF0111/DUF47 family)